MSSVNPAFPEPERQTSFRVLSPVGGGPLVRLDRSALRDMERHVREGVKAFQGRGAEVGGVVIGPALNWSSQEITITGFVPVDLTNRFGSAYRPTEADTLLFASAVIEGGDGVIGYYRSHLCDESTVRADDERLLQQLFPISDSCFLAVHASPATPSNVDLYQVRKGAAPELLELFSLKERELPQAAPDRGQKSPTHDPHKPDAQQPAQLDPSSAVEKSENQDEALLATAHPQPPTTVATGSHRWWWIGVCAALIIGLAVAAFTVERAPRNNPASASAQIPAAVFNMSPRQTQGAVQEGSIDLHMTELGSQATIRWNPLSSTIVSATRGMLTITEGSTSGQAESTVSDEIDLNAHQIHSGRFEYTPAKQSFTAQLMVYQADGTFTGDTRQFVATQPRSAPARTEAAIVTEPVPSIKKFVLEEKPVPVRIAAVFPTRTSHDAAKPNSLPTFEEPPPSASAMPQPASALSNILASAAAPPVSVSPPPAQNLNYHATRSSVPTRLLAPRLVHQTVPSIPLGIAPRIKSETRIDVDVAVDADGKATGAHIVSSQGAAASMLAIEALKAAQLCRFLPAQQDGMAVAGNLIVTFRFAPKSN